MSHARTPATLPARRARFARHRLTADASGTGLLEVLIATLLLSIVAIGMVEFFAKGRVWFDHEEHKRVATLLAQEAMEKTVARPYGNILPWAQQRTVSSIRYAINVTTQNNMPASSMKTVRSTVTWQATPTAQRTVSLATFVYDH